MFSIIIMNSERLIPSNSFSVSSFSKEYLVFDLVLL